MDTFKVAGLSKLDGKVKVRFANEMDRIKILIKKGHANIELMELPTPMEKPAVVKHLMTVSKLMENSEYRQAIEDANEKYNGVKITKIKADAPSMDKLTQRAKAKVETTV